jgi:hypothetical protein
MTVEQEALTQKLIESPESLTFDSKTIQLPSLNSRIMASRYIWKNRLARKEQLPPEGDWNIWLYMAGRGAGKTRTAAEWIAWEAIENQIQDGPLLPLPSQMPVILAQKANQAF